MGCYLCAWGSHQKPDDYQPLPADSPVAATEPLGTCHRCFVWACSEHASRFSWYECAICTPARAAAAALTGSGVGGASTAQAHRAGELTSQGLRQSATDLINLLAAERDRPVEVRAELAASGVGEPNLVLNLAESIRSLADNRFGVTALGPDGRTADLSFDAIGASVRERFAGRPIEPATQFSATVVAGALVMAYTLADPPYAARRLELEAGLEPRLPPPWQVSNPAILDPTLWMLGTAYTIGQQ